MFSRKSVIMIIVTYFAIPFFAQHVIVFVSSSFFCSIKSGTANWSSIFHNINLYILFLYIFLHHFIWAQKIAISFKFSE